SPQLSCMGTTPPSTPDGNGIPHMHWLHARAVADPERSRTTPAASATKRRIMDSPCMKSSDTAHMRLRAQCLHEQSMNGSGVTSRTIVRSGSAMWRPDAAGDHAGKYGEAERDRTVDLLT